MDRPITELDGEEIDREIAGRFRLLRFRPSIESVYEIDESDSRCKHVIQQNYVGLVIYCCFLVGDYFVIRDAFKIDLLVHLFMMPVLFATNYICSRRPPVWLREGVQSFGLSIMSLSILVVVSASQSPDRDLIHFTSILNVAYVTIVLRTRFWYALAGCLICHVIFSAGLMTLTPFSVERTIISNLLFFSVVVFSLIGAYDLEHAQRMSYLLALRDRFRNIELEKASLRDALTGVGNRRALDAELRSLTTCGEVSLQSVAVLLIDIDHFKLFNDANGHQKGDVCLKQVADIIAKNVRRSEGTVFRFGGEEFLVLLKEVQLSVALMVAQRIRWGVASAAIPRDRSTNAAVTVSIGAAAGCIERDTTPEDLIGAADTALYAAKRNGRDQVWPLAIGSSSPRLWSGTARRAGDRAICA